MRPNAILFLVLIILNGHDTLGQTIDPTSATCRIEIFLVEKTKKDTTTSCRYCFSPTPYDLADTAFIKDAEITGYGISNGHYSFLLSDNCMKKLKALDKGIGAFSRDPFAVVVNGEPIYGGWFLTTYVSNNHACDWIHIFTPFDRDENGKLEVLLHPSARPNYKDPRSNKLLLDCLNKTKRLMD